MLVSAWEVRIIHYAVNLMLINCSVRLSLFVCIVIPAMSHFFLWTLIWFKNYIFKDAHICACFIGNMYCFEVLVIMLWSNSDKWTNEVYLTPIGLFAWTFIHWCLFVLMLSDIFHFIVSWNIRLNVTFLF